MDRLFYSNIDSLSHQNTITAVLVCGFFFFPVFFDKDYAIAITYSIVAGISTILSLVALYFSKQYKSGKKISQFTVYTLIVFTYAVIVFFGTFLSVIINPLRPASVYLPIIVAAMFFFTVSPVFKLIVTLIGWAAFIAVAARVKTPDIMAYEITNSAAAIALSLILGWHASMLRITSTDKTIALEKERDSYHDQSTVDELTTLKNRRDFMQRLERYLNRPRYTDDAFCLAIADIDYFKNYNDYYGHKQGDECLRSIGKALGDLAQKKNFYAARIGGEEFALLWFVDSSTDVEAELQQVHDAIRALNITHERSAVAPKVTLSIGAYVLYCSFENDFNTVYERADQALYKAKNDGRNRSIVHDARKESVAVTMTS